MWKTSFILSVVSLLATSAFAARVITLQNEAEFNKVVADNHLVMVKFFAPWCGHCKAMIPEYEIAAKELHEDNVVLAELNCVTNGDICQKFKVKGYPTLQVFRNGQSSDIYPFERTSASIVKFMKQRVTPELSKLEDKATLDQLKKDEKILVVAYFHPSQKDSIIVDQWRQLSNKLADDFVFAYSTNNRLAQEESIDRFPTVVLYKQFDAGKDIHEGLFLDDQIEDFIKVNSVPFLDDITPETFMNYVDANRPLVYVFSTTDKMKQELNETFYPLAKEYRGKFSFVHIDGQKYSSQAEFLSLDNKKFPAMAIHNLRSGGKFPYTKKMDNKKQIKKYLNDVHSEKVAPAVKSEAHPVRNPADAVKVVVGNNFEEIVMDKTKDVFIDIYAPWCGHCKALAPTWQKLGQVVKDLNPANLVIAKMDGTVNDVPLSAGFQVTGYPTIKFFRAKTNEMLDYHGSRALNDMVNFLKEQAQLDIDLEKLLEEKVKREEEFVEKHDEL